MQKIVIATYNKGKYAEFQAFFAAHGFETVAAYELELPDVEEGDVSFADNARLKAEAAMRLTGLPALGDDSGLEIPELNNFPGVVTARFTKECGGYPAAVRHYLDTLNKKSCTARYVAELCLAQPSQPNIFVRAAVEGKLTADRRGEREFGYDQWFVPEGFTQSCAELSLAEKEKISHRGKALRLLMEKLKPDDRLRAVS
jgi:XTP/dITP diphosphohydrolase